MTLDMLTPLRDTMHTISSGLLAPAIVILLLLLAVSVIELGGLLVEVLTERRKMKVNVPEMVEFFQGKDAGAIMRGIESSGLFRRQKAALGELIRHGSLPAASLQALARKLLAAEELHYARITNRTDLVARLGPMLGLMATLIPLGPGMIALGQGDTKTLAESLLTAFDATVIGLAAAGVAYAVSRLRKRWYEGYLSSLEALMESLLEVFARGRRIEEQ
ncbi:MotA/TolQ/ExbB proton channel family protein [Pelotomaculum schinkii]|uniref:MotA/TolQ/ExbB proton channel family protein n=1 Tax=Pelotomaculum schinkii TaxID=78350 RepID=A0A4Y7RGE7_9FIRM|nr:MotA/TolQ/ExbB proton channel family protein [Pelotomaculum schinkii]TEB08074.1 MotA/TolQ/ExbB proton channel family protein [Pelotomaculum schinkii]